MAKLQNERHEAFAVLLAHGVTLGSAYESAGFAPDKGHPSRLAARADISTRVAEIRGEFTDTSFATKPETISALLKLARRALKAEYASGFKEARLAFLDASRLYDEMTAAQAADPKGPGDKAERPAEPAR
jgi:hypothetical protein